jgi:hypothetical protein
MNRTSSAANPEGITSQDAQAILALRLLIARAAQTDSLSWWEDEALTQPAGFILERTFPVAPHVAGRSLAIRAAARRQEDACAGIAEAIHLYRLDLDNRDRLVLRFMLPTQTPVPEKPIQSMDELRQHLLHLTGVPVQSTPLHRTNTRALEIGPPPAPAGVSPLLHRARAFAWAYLEGEPGNAVFPFCLEKST